MVHKCYADVFIKFYQATNNYFKSPILPCNYIFRNNKLPNLIANIPGKHSGFCHGLSLHNNLSILCTADSLSSSTHSGGQSAGVML